MQKDHLMASEKVHLTKEKETMLIMLYGRALRCRSKHPILRDTWAEEAIQRVDYDFANLKLHACLEAVLELPHPPWPLRPAGCIDGQRRWRTVRSP